MARFMTLVPALKAKGTLAKSAGALPANGVEHEEWDVETVKEHMPSTFWANFGRPAGPKQVTLLERAGEYAGRAIFTPGSGYVNDPQLATII